MIAGDSLDLNSSHGDREGGQDPEVTGVGGRVDVEGNRDRGIRDDS